MAQEDQFKKNLNDFFGINHITQPDEIIKDKLNKYIFHIVGENIKNISDSDDFLIGGNKSLELDTLIKSKLNNQLVYKFNNLVLNISINFTTKYYQTLTENEKYVFEAFIINKMDSYALIIKEMMDDSYWHQNFSYYGIKKNTDIKKFISNQMSCNPKITPVFINMCNEIENHKNEKPEKCLVL